MTHLEMNFFHALDARESTTPLGHRLAVVMFSLERYDRYVKVAEKLPPQHNAVLVKFKEMMKLTQVPQFLECEPCFCGTGGCRSSLHFVSTRYLAW
jgi:hypothetical protein